MVYCNLISVQGERAIYSIGGKTNDMSGRIVMDFSTGEYELVKEPENSKVYPHHIDHVFIKAKAQFLSGSLQKKIAYEIG